VAELISRAQEEAVGVLRKKVNWVLDADIRGYFDAIDHGCWSRSSNTAWKILG
jgi:hypothetical protein